MYFGPITNIETKHLVASLTFDDGPHPEFTPRVLAILEKHGAKATFFMLGESASKYPEIVKMVAEAGHTIGNHSWNHPLLPSIGFRLHRMRQIWACARATAPYGAKLFRPPYGAHDRKVWFDALILGYKIVLWSESAQDWTPQGPEEIAQKIIDRVRPGSIFLLHDTIYKSHLQETQWDREPMLQGLDKALAELNQKIRFVTVSELLRAGRPVYKWPHSSE
jgi:peptidoglycan/xylan/chitin deacetylase (PgdA/CDA1 family)